MDKQNGTHLCNGILFGLRKEGHWFSLIPAAAAAAPVFSGSLRYFPFTSRNVVTNEAACGVITVFSDVKVCKSSSPEDVKQHKKKVLFCLSEDTNLMLEEGGSCWWVKTSDDATPLLSQGCHTRM